MWSPPGWDGSQALPLLVDLVGYTGTGASHTNWRPFGLSLPERLDRLHARGDLGPVFVALPDCFTAYGGNQYVDSEGTGPYMRYLVEEVVPAVEARFPVLPGREHRGVFGKSSGGYGALVHALLRPDVWGAAACHSGDMYWEYVYLPAFPRLARKLLDTDGDVAAWLAKVWAKEKLGHDESDALMTLGMAAHYDGDAATPLGFHLPIRWPDGTLIPERWERWLRWDPVRLVESHGEALRSLRGLWIDCGRKDQYHLLWGARRVHGRLEELGVPHRYEEFDDDHSDIDYRMDLSLPYLYRAVAPRGG